MEGNGEMVMEGFEEHTKENKYAQETEAARSIRYESDEVAKRMRKRKKGVADRWNTHGEGSSFLRISLSGYTEKSVVTRVEIRPACGSPSAILCRLAKKNFFRATILGNP